MTGTLLIKCPDSKGVVASVAQVGLVRVARKVVDTTCSAALWLSPAIVLTHLQPVSSCS